MHFECLWYDANNQKINFVINVEKSQLEPTIKLKILAFFIDSVKKEVSLIKW